MILSISGSDHPVARTVHDEASLRAILEHVTAPHRVAFQLRGLPAGRDQRSLMVGVHGDRGVLWWSDLTLAESQIALGSDNVDDILYYVGCADLEFPPGAELPRVVVINAAAEYFITGERPAHVRSWTDERQAFAQGSPRHMRP